MTLKEVLISLTLFGIPAFILVVLGTGLEDTFKAFAGLALLILPLAIFLVIMFPFIYLGIKRYYFPAEPDVHVHVTIDHQD